MFYTVVTQPGEKLSEPGTSIPPTPGVDVPALGVKEMHQLLRSRARCLQAGLGATHPIVKTLDDIRDAYVARVGVGLYFKQMVEAIGLTNRDEVIEPHARPP